MVEDSSPGSQNNYIFTSEKRKLATGSTLDFNSGPSKLKATGLHLVVDRWIPLATLRYLDHDRGFERGTAEKLLLYERHKKIGYGALFDSDSE